jgi:outer membrane immunogenic protein
MIRFVLGVVALIAAGWTSSAQAADMNYGSRAPYTVNQPLNAYSWAGPYIGGNLGYAWGSVDNNPTKPSGFVGGVQAGYNWQNGPWVFGIEGDLQATGADDTFAPWKFSNPWFGTLRGRIGFAMNNILFYGTLGIALGTVRLDAATLEQSRMHTGWAAGLGMEVGLTEHWSARAEYLYVDLSDRNYAFTGVTNGLESNILRLGVNYRF